MSESENENTLHEESESQSPVKTKQPLLTGFQRIKSGAKQMAGKAWGGIKSGAKQGYNWLAENYGDNIGSLLTTIGKGTAKSAPTIAKGNLGLGVAAAGGGLALQSIGEMFKTDQKKFKPKTSAKRKVIDEDDTIPTTKEKRAIGGLYTPNTAVSGGGRKKLILYGVSAPEAKPKARSKAKPKATTTKKRTAKK